MTEPNAFPLSAQIVTKEPKIENLENGRIGIEIQVLDTRDQSVVHVGFWVKEETSPGIYDGEVVALEVESTDDPNSN